MNADIKSLKNGMFWKTFSTGINAIAGFVMSIIYARFLSKELYGELVLVYTVILLFVILSNFGLNAALRRFIPLYIKRKDEKKFTRFILTTAGMGMLFTTFFSVAMFFMTDFISINIFHKPSLIPYMKWGVLYLFSHSLLSNIVFSIYYGFQKWKEECALNALYLFSSASMMFIVLSVFNKGVAEVLKVNAATCLMAVIVGIFYMVRFIRPVMASLKFGEFTSQIKETLHFSTPLLMSGLFFYFVVQFDKIILGMYRPSEEISQYYIAFALGTGILMFVKVSEIVFTPYLAKLTEEDGIVIKNKFQTIFRLFLHIPIIFSIFLYFLIDPFINFIYGPDFGITATALKIYLIIIVLRSAMTPIGLFLIYVYGKTFEITKLSVVNASMHFILYFTLIPKFGYIGALVAIIIAYIAVWIYIVLFIGRINKLIPYRSLLYAGIGIVIVLGINFIAQACHIYNKLLLSIILPLVYLLFALLKGDIELGKLKNAL